MRREALGGMEEGSGCEVGGGAGKEEGEYVEVREGSADERRAERAGLEGKGEGHDAKRREVVGWRGGGGEGCECGGRGR